VWVMRHGARVDEQVDIRKISKDTAQLTFETIDLFIFATKKNVPAHILIFRRQLCSVLKTHITFIVYACRSFQNIQKHCTSRLKWATCSYFPKKKNLAADICIFKGQLCSLFVVELIEWRGYCVKRFSRCVTVCVQLSAF